MDKNPRLPVAELQQPIQPEHHDSLNSRDQIPNTMLERFGSDSLIHPLESRKVVCGKAGAFGAKHRDERNIHVLENRLDDPELSPDVNRFTLHATKCLQADPRLQMEYEVGPDIETEGKSERNPTMSKNIFAHCVHMPCSEKLIDKEIVFLHDRIVYEVVH